MGYEVTLWAIWLLAAGAARAQTAPSIYALTPSSVAAGGPAFNLVVDGANFTSSSAVQWNGAPRTGVVQGTTRIIAYIPNSDINVPGVSTVTVADPAGGVSNAVAFPITGPPPAGCASPANRIVAENCLHGSPKSDWDVQGAGDPSIQGFATDISFAPGDAVSFKVMTDAAAYSLKIYRLGWYQGLGARLVAAVSPSAALPQSQPACAADAATGLIDCGNWAVSASWTIPADAVSGLYFAKLVRADTGGASHVVFVVRDDAGRSDVLLQTSDATWQAYNDYGGNSLYVGSPIAAYKVSYDRPFRTRATHSSWFTYHEQAMIRWLESDGYDVSYFTDADSDRRGALIKNHKVFLSVGHDEYWSAGQRAAVEAARAGGTHLGFFSGNEIFWKTRWESDGAGTPYRTLVTYKETFNDKIDPADPPTWTGMWRDKQFSPTSDGGRPENALTGQLYGVDAFRNDAMIVGAAEGRLRFWRGTSVASLSPGGSAAFPELLGYEWDAERDNGSRPPGLMILSSTTYSVPQLLTTTSYAPGAATHHATLYRHASGALVFGAGTMQWAWGLDNGHDGGSQTAADPRLQQATMNLLADMGVQPTTPRAGLTPASPSTDATPPVSAVVSPAPGTNVTAGVPVAVSGTAADSGGGVVAAVEVSTNGGAAWHPALGRESWSWTWTPDASGPASLLSRASDDSGNLENKGVTANPFPALASMSPSSAAPGAAAFTLTVNGSGFLPGSVVQWNGAARATAYVSPSQLAASIPAGDVASAAAAGVTVLNPSPGGGASNALFFKTQSPGATQPLPIIAALTPSAASPGDPAFNLVVDGSSFTAGTYVRWNGASQPTTVQGTTRLVAYVPAGDVAAPATASVTAFTPGGGASNVLSFTVGSGGATGNPVPSLSSLSPSSTTAGGPGFALNVYGAGFVASASALWNGSARPTAFVSATLLTASIAAGDIASSGIATVTAFNPGPGGGTSNALTFAIAPSTAAPNNPAPALSALSPSSATAGGRGFTLTVDGTSFASSATVQWNGAARPTTFVSSSRLAASISSGDVASSGTASVTAFNPGPGGGTSNALTFTIASSATVSSNPAPSLTSLTPSSATAGGPGFTLTVNGTSFVSSATVQWNGAARATTFVSSTQLAASILAGDAASSGTASVTAFNPGPGGGTSNALAFAIAASTGAGRPAPTLSVLTPSSAAAGGPAFNLVADGTNFTSSSTLMWNGAARHGAVQGTARIVAYVPWSDIAAPGTASVSVFDPAGGSSNVMPFAVTGSTGGPNPVPVVSVLTPSAVAAGSPAFNLVVDGTGFVSSSVVQWNGTRQPTVYQGATRLIAYVPAGDVAAPGTASVTVLSPAPGGGTSGPATFTISTGPAPAALADPTFALRAAYAFPNPARGASSVVFRIQPGLADAAAVRVYDLSGRKVHESSDFTSRGAFDDGNGLGAQYTYDHVWDVGGVGSGVYTFVLSAAKSGDADVRKTGKVGVIK